MYVCIYIQYIYIHTIQTSKVLTISDTAVGFKLLLNADSRASRVEEADFKSRALGILNEVVGIGENYISPNMVG